MSNTINETYINALLADASYVELRVNAVANLTKRLTQPLAEFIVANFEVINQDK